MTSAIPASPRTQAERSAATRRALLEATAASLMEIGYAGTSTTEVARRAGVSRGAQTHHFPTKSDLVVAAVEHVFAQQEEQFLHEFDALPDHDRTLEGALELLWRIISGPPYTAILELIVAARTDPELSTVVQAIAAGFETAIRGHLASIFPALAAHDIATDIVGFAFAVLQGAAINDSVGFFGPTTSTIDMLRALARFPIEDLTALVSIVSPTPESQPEE